MKLDYLSKIPTKNLAGVVVVHNNVGPTRRLGQRGFRAWLAEPDDQRLVVCNCDWAPELGTHYRVVQGEQQPKEEQRG